MSMHTLNTQMYLTLYKSRINKIIYGMESGYIAMLYELANSLPHWSGRSLHRGSANERELSLAIYVQEKIFRGIHVSTKIFYL